MFDIILSLGKWKLKFVEISLNLTGMVKIKITDNTKGWKGYEGNESLT